MLREFDVDSVVHRHDPLVHSVSVMSKELLLQLDWRYGPQRSWILVPVQEADRAGRGRVRRDSYKGDMTPHKKKSGNFLYRVFNRIR